MNYYNKKEELKRKASAHYADIIIRLKKETEDSIKRTIICGNEVYGCYEPGFAQFYLRQTDSVSCAFMENYQGKTAILNYASYKYPGGQFMQGSSAQEEALCHESNLYPILLAFDYNYYYYNRANVNRSLYNNIGLYTPDVVFEHNNEKRTFDVITCAAPNWGSASKYHNVSPEENYEVMRDRIKFMYEMAASQGVQNLIAGAWGCGVFKQNPADVCKLLIAYAPEGMNVYFAIPDDKNYEEFYRVIRKL